MELLKLNVSKKAYGKYGYSYNFSLFRCPVCGDSVERYTQSGLKSRACSGKCSRKIAKDLKELASGNKANICINCAVDDCKWLLKGKPIEGWDATLKEYRAGNKPKHITYTYHITACPNFKKMGKGKK